eukprot:gene13303-biopygen18551
MSIVQEVVAEVGQTHNCTPQPANVVNRVPMTARKPSARESLSDRMTMHSSRIVDLHDRRTARRGATQCSCPG